MSTEKPNTAAVNDAPLIINGGVGGVAIIGGAGGSHGDGGDVNLTAGSGGDAIASTPAANEPQASHARSFLSHPMSTWLLGIIGSIVVASVIWHGKARVRVTFLHSPGFMRMAQLACHRQKNRAGYGFKGNRRYRKCYSDPDFHYCGFLTRISTDFHADF